MTTTLQSLRRIEQICSEFELAGKLGPQHVAARLDEVDAADRTPLATELIALDAELRFAAGQTPAAEEYRPLLERTDVSLPASQLSQLIEHATASDGELQTTPPQSNRYQFLEHIGQGAYGDVWRVEDSHSQRVLAVKVARQSSAGDPNASNRLLREALVTGKLQHPGVPPIYDQGELLGGEAYFAMKLVGGATLESLLSQRTSQSEDLQRTLTIFQSVAQTIAYAHSQGVIHRDLKPHNIMVGDFGEVQVMDWGMAKPVPAPTDALPQTSPSLTDTVVERQHSTNKPNDDSGALLSSDSLSSLTTEGDILGTPAYMSPEQARGEKSRLDTSSDVFSLGAILFQILTEKRLHDARSSSEAIRRTATGELGESLALLDAASVNRELAGLCKRCLAASPAARPDANELCQTLSNYFAQVETRARQAELDHREAMVMQAESSRRRRVQVIAACLVAIASCIGTFIALWQRSEAIEAQQAAVDAQAQEAEARAIASRESETAEEVNGFLLDLLASARPEEQGVDVTIREALDTMLPEVEDRFRDNPKVEGLVRRAFGTTYRSLGIYDVALQQFRLAVKALKRVEPLDENELLNAQDRLAGMLRYLGKPEGLQEARTLREHVLARATELFGEDDYRTMLAMNNLAVVYSNLQEHEKAQALMERSIAIEEASGKGDPMSVDMSRFNLATFAFDRKDYKTAERVFVTLIEKYRTDPKGVRLYLSLTKKLAILYAEQGRDEEALAYFREALASRREALGELHDSTLSIKRKLGRHLIAMQRYKEALPFVKESLEQHIQYFSAATSVTISVRHNVAEALEGLGRRDEAEEALKETVAVLIRDRGEDYPNTLDAKRRLAEFLDRSPNQSPIPTPR